MLDDALCGFSPLPSWLRNGDRLLNTAAVVVDAMEDDAYRELKEDSWRGEKKHLLDGLGQLRRRLKKLTQWHGLLYLEERLYSTICPKRGTKIVEVENRVMKCACGFKAHRDNVPMTWAENRYWELLQKTKQPTFSTLATIKLLTS
ncbi:transposase, IS605 OrfB [Pyrobaculum islandicum DSM 4184]|uniref:Transposase, IS605 OrfB n=1 Tax=Pyrobaculum islandicum (strain DSM 4184 / JCM 9189 / GEO3) TaxID=384616 RepID=A1RR79_PYRIL|nr:zinc ribbon domain-containing protein [Pyrobaculum islandicum]ABL87461.1 transposase, IS605 OrfB [Pyrobaculum islandicum DSM 4184]